MSNQTICWRCRTERQPSDLRQVTVDETCQYQCRDRSRCDRMPRRYLMPEHFCGEGAKASGGARKMSEIPGSEEKRQRRRAMSKWEETLLGHVAEVSMEKRLDHLRHFRQIVTDVAGSLKEKRKELRREAGDADSPLATFLLTEETRLLIALGHAEKVGLTCLRGEPEEP
jgi:hypothetical protein